MGGELENGWTHITQIVSWKHAPDSLADDLGGVFGHLIFQTPFFQVSNVPVNKEREGLIFKQKKIAQYES